MGTPPDAPGKTLPGEPLPVAVQPAPEPVPSVPRTQDDDAPGAGGDAAKAPGVVLAPLAGSQPRRAARLPAGTIIDHKYEIQRFLGEGGMGVVYLARDVHTGLFVVLKAVRQEIAHRRDVRARTLAEGRALAQIDHPNVVRLNAVVEEQGSLWLVMQYIEGEGLDRLIARHAREGKPIPIDEALALFRQIASGVGAAHREGVIHRDLKPANVMVRSKDGVAKVTDFGIAKEEADAIAGRGLTKGIIGSLSYMSPEQVIGRRDLDKRVDVYALGILLYEVLTGRVPFEGDHDVEIMRKQLEAPLPRVSDARPDAPPELDAILQRACAKDRAERFASCDELCAAIDALGRRLTLAAPAGASALPGAPGFTPAPGPSGAPPPFSTAPPAPPAPSTAPPPPTTATASGPGVPATLDGPGGRAGRRLALAVAGIVLAMGAGVAGLFAAGVLPPEDRARPATPPAPEATSPSASASAEPNASAEPSPAPTGAPLSSLAGPWVGNGRELDAVLAGDVLEFRVRKPEQFAPQDYVAGEVRFALRALPGEPGVFAMEDHLRFFAPVGLEFDAARARGTCQDVRSSAEGRPLRARFDGARLSVEFVRVEPAHDTPGVNFIVEGGRVVSCRGLGALPAARVMSTLTRP